MNARFDPLTARYARNLHELTDDPRSWWTNAEAAAAQEEWYRASFDEDDRRRIVRPTPWIGRALYIIGLCALAALALKFLKH